MTVSLIKILHNMGREKERLFSADAKRAEATSSRQTRASARAGAGAGAGAGSSEAAPSYEDAVRSTGHIPTVDAPFDFPSNAELPPYEASDAALAQQLPIAIPQTYPDAASPFVLAYPPSLLSHGITETTWRSFLETESAFLTAKVGDRAVAHAGDMAKRLGQTPKNFGVGLFSQAKSVGRNITTHAKRGNIIGAAAGVVGGVISLPISAAVGVVGTALSLPGSAINAVTSRPRTPLERAATYSAVANKDWLNARGLHAALLDTAQLGEVLKMDASKVLEMARASKDEGAQGRLAALEGHIEKLKVDEGQIAELGKNSLWLVLLPVQPE